MRISKSLAFVLLIGLLLRLVALFNSPIVNPDGVLYIHQAKALYYGEWDKLTSFGLSFISNYPVMIAAGYPIFKNWIISARFVSIFFGFTTLLPLYALLRRFFNRETSTFVTLIYALIPIFIGAGADVVRDPVYWFFMVSGLYLFIKSLGGSVSGVWLTLGNLSFLMATWARMEGVLFIIVSVLYLLIVEPRNGVKKAIVFLAPTAGIIILSAFGTMVSGISIHDFYRGGEIVAKLAEPIFNYQELRRMLADMASDPRNAPVAFFLPEARNAIWLIAWGTLLNGSLEAFFYPFLPFFILGVKGIRGAIRNDRRILYFLFLVISGYLLLYFHLLQKWIMDCRFLATVIFPCAVFAGFGAQRSIGFIRSKLKGNDRLVVVLLAGLLIISVLPKNLHPRDSDKIVFKTIGERIASREAGNLPVNISASLHTQRWISFYANLKYPGPLCLEPTLDSCWELYPFSELDDWVTRWKKQNITYVIWAEKHWPERISLSQIENHPAFCKLETWHHPDTGWIILFELK